MNRLVLCEERRTMQPAREACLTFQAWRIRLSSPAVVAQRVEAGRLCVLTFLPSEMSFSCRNTDTTQAVEAARLRVLTFLHAIRRFGCRALCDFAIRCTPVYVSVQKDTHNLSCPAQSHTTPHAVTSSQPTYRLLHILHFPPLLQHPPTPYPSLDHQPYIHQHPTEHHLCHPVATSPQLARYFTPHACR